MKSMVPFSNLGWLGFSSSVTCPSFICSSQLQIILFFSRFVTTHATPCLKKHYPMQSNVWQSLRTESKRNKRVPSIKNLFAAVAGGIIYCPTLAYWFMTLPMPLLTFPIAVVHHLALQNEKKLKKLIKIWTQG